MMRFFAFEKDGETRLGVEREGVQHDITRGAVRDFGKRLISEFLQADELDALIGSIDDQTLLLEEMPDQFTWLPPIPRPGKILAMVQNYRKHAAEFGNQAPPAPVWFGKIASSLTGHGTAVKIPDWVDGRVDHEVELGVVMGAYAKEVLEDSALGLVAGYTIVNDLSARRIQRDDRENKHPWLRCKNFDTFTPMGPYFVPARYVPDPQALKIICRVNDETRQDATTADMVHPVRKIIAEMSRWMTLEPGDVIATGTPEGVYNLRNGDVVECEIAGLGILRNPVERPQVERDA
ncbi:MAG: fumarylacetoacetate hydrolase family protein [Planctomycetes bacterium]|nr:fumarylacetoacetate hydrolase family protein [Planctomycetota bacterium]